MSHEQTDSSSLFSPAVEALVSLGAAITCNDELAFKQHLQNALGLGISCADVAMAIAAAREVKGRAAERMQQIAGEQLAAARDIGPLPGTCCCAK